MWDMPFLLAIDGCNIYEDSIKMKNGAIVYSKSQVERYKACGVALEVDAEIADGDRALEDTGS